MAVGYTKLADVTAADANDPNVDAPDADRIFEIPQRRQGANFPVGVAWYVSFVAGTTPDASYTLWILDEFTDTWIAVASEANDTGLAHKTAKDLPAGAKAFFEVTGIVGSPTSLAHHVRQI